MLAQDPGFARVTEALGSSRRVGAGGAPPGSWPVLAIELQRQLGRSLLVLAPDPAAVADGIRVFDGVPNPYLFPAADVLPVDRTPPSDEIVGARLEALAAALSSPDPIIVVTSPAGLMRPAPPPEVFRHGVRRLSIGAALRMDELIGWLVDWGWHP